MWASNDNWWPLIRCLGRAHIKDPFSIQCMIGFRHDGSFHTSNTKIMLFTHPSSMLPQNVQMECHPLKAELRKVNKHFPEHTKSAFHQAKKNKTKSLLWAVPHLLKRNYLCIYIYILCIPKSRFFFFKKKNNLRTLMTQPPHTTELMGFRGTDA